MDPVLRSLNPTFHLLTLLCKRVRINPFFAAALTLFATFQDAQATSFFIRPLPEFSSGASLVVRGTITKVRVEYGTNEDGQRAIYTYADLQVEDTLKGKADSYLILRKLGGEKDGTSLDIAGSPDFKENEMVVAFVDQPNPDGSYNILGMELGKLNATQDPSGRDWVLSGGILNYSSGIQHSHDEHEESSSPKTLKLSELKKILQTAPANTATVGQKPPMTPSGQTTDPISKLDEDNSNPVSDPEQIAQNSDPENIADEKGKKFPFLPVLTTVLGLFFAVLTYSIFKKSKQK